MAAWLFKTEPDTFSIDDLANKPNKREGWDGVRNYQARNFMRDSMQVGDDAFIYHSSCNVPGIAGLAKVSKTGLVDPTQFNPESSYFDPKSTPENPRWIMVELEYVETFVTLMPLKKIKENPNINVIPLVNKSRLSVMPVNKKEFDILLSMSRNHTLG